VGAAWCRQNAELLLGMRSGKDPVNIRRPDPGKTHDRGHILPVFGCAGLPM
jgi:hypothetical protein